MRHHQKFTPLKFNMEPENQPLEKDIPIGNHHFEVPCLNFGGVVRLAYLAESVPAPPSSSMSQPHVKRTRSHWFVERLWPGPWCSCWSTPHPEGKLMNGNPTKWARQWAMPQLSISIPKNSGLSWDILRMGLDPLILNTTPGKGLDS